MRLSFLMFILLAGCATAQSSGVQEVGPDTYTITASATMQAGGKIVARNMVLTEATDYCSKQGKEILVSSIGQPNPNRRGAMEITFRCYGEAPRHAMASSASNTETIWRTPDSCHAIYEKEGRRFGITDITEACEALERHLQYLEGRLVELCEKAGEHIEKTIENVEGVYIHYPLDGSPYYHELDRVVGSYVAPGARKFYRFVEFDDPRAKSGIFHYASGEKQQKLSEPVSPYEVTWKRLTDARDQQRGLHGEELTITDRSTKNVLATRTIFYYVLTEQFLRAEGIYQQVPSIPIPPKPSEYQIATCKTYHPVWDSPYTDKRRPRDSYGFVSRVLKPKEPTMASVIASFDLARGSGRKLDTCPMVIHIGPNIALADLQITNPLRFDVEISVKRTDDSLVCLGILHPTAKRRRGHMRIFFYDGTSTSLTQLIQPFLYTDEQN